MINWIAASSTLILIVALLRRILRGRIALRLQYALWLVVLVRLLFPLELGSLPFALSNAVEQIPVVQEFGDIQDVQTIEHTESGAVVGYSGTPDETAPLQIYDKKTDAEFTHIENTLKLREVAAHIWKAGIAVLLAVFFASNMRLSRRLKKERTLLSVTCDLPVYITSQVETPCLFGFFSPTIYVTPEVTADGTVLRHTLEHELIHYRHWDQLWAILRCIALALHWYNPLVWWAAKLSRSDAELACDEATLMRLGEDERSAYGRTLIEMTCQGPSRLLTTATTMTGSKGTLKERISLIAKKPKMAIYTLAAVILIAACAAVFTFTGSDVSTNRKLCDWMQSVTTEELSYAYISEGYGTAVTSYTLDSDFRAELIRILNDLEWSQFGMDQHVGAPERRLFAATGTYLDWDEEFIFGICEDDRISISFTTEFGEEISKPGKGWYVTSPELSQFINDILDGKTSNAAAFPAEPLEFVFASGAGAWGTDLILQPDGSFAGDYRNSDADRCFVCEFEGQFTDIQQINDHCWTMELDEVTSKKEKGTSWTDGNIHYIADEPYGISNGTTFILYAPGTPADELPAACKEWWPDAYYWRNGEQDSLDGWALYNMDAGHSFFTSWIS